MSHTPNESASNRPDTFKERRQERLQAKSRDLTVDEWRERKAANQERWRREQIEKLEGTPLAIRLTPDLAVNGKVELAAWEGSYSSLLTFLKVAYERGGERNPDELTRKARAVQRLIITAVGDDYLAMTSAAMLRLDGNKLSLTGVHSNKHGKRVEELVAERQLEARLAEVPSQPVPLRSPEGPSVLLTGNASGVRSVAGGTLKAVDLEADLGIVQRPDGTYVSNGTKPGAGKNTVDPASL